MREIGWALLCGSVLVLSLAGCTPPGCDVSTGTENCAAANLPADRCAAARRLCEAYVYDPDYRPYY